ncbi:MAG: RNA polymerase sigma factor (sigma-70 family) [Candidatus Aldehydirespiratoraceae bacterium]|jgi:RNA polymerase sigma factor (sigma-70 family)
MGRRCGDHLGLLDTGESVRSKTRTSTVLARSRVFELFRAIINDASDLNSRFRAGDESVVREIVQQTFVKAWRAASTFEEERELAPWLCTIARRTAIDVLRREMKPTAGDHEPETDVAVTTMSFERTWKIYEARRALDDPSPDEREIVRLSYLFGWSHPEIAAIAAEAGSITSITAARRWVPGSSSMLPVCLLPSRASTTRRGCAPDQRLV